MDKLQTCQSSQSSSKIVKCDGQHDGRVDETLPVDLPPHEIVLSIDHILDQIFRYLDTRDLFACRLVSFRFLKFAHTPLKKRTGLSFTDYLHKTSRRNESTGRSLIQLTEILKTSLTASASTSTKFNSFPCSDFSFHSSPRLGDKVFQDFLNTNGPNIKKLLIYNVSADRIHENVLMDQIFFLLGKQAPNLETLYLCIFPTVEWQQELSTQIQDSVKRSSYSPLYKTDPEFQQISFQVESFPKKSCLKKLEIHGSGWAKTLEFLLQISPKLQKVVTEKDNYVHLVYPVNRIHLLKSLEFAPEPDMECFDMEALEQISLESKLRLTALGIDFSDALKECKVNREFENKVVAMTNRLLEGSKDTLQYLGLSSVTFLRGMKMPSSMPNVEEVGFSEEKCETNSTIFPNGFSFSKTFPKLASVKITFFESPNPIDVNTFYNYLMRFDFEEKGEGTALSLGVKKVILDAECFLDEWHKAIPVPTFISEKIHKIFPNASIEVETHYSV